MKNKQRQFMLECRRKLSAEDVSNHSSKIKQKLQNLKCIQNADCIMVYFAHAGEVALHEFAIESMAFGKCVALPYCLQKGVMTAVQYTENCDLEANRYGIPEPSGSQELLASDIDVIIVPALAFDTDLHRIGYGGGYYDRFLKKTSAIKIGVAFDFQIMDKLPKHDHDVPVDMVISEARMIGAVK